MHQGDYDEKDFEGHSYERIGIMPLRTKFGSIPNAGVSKSFRIIDDAGNI